MVSKFNLCSSITTNYKLLSVLLVASVQPGNRQAAESLLVKLCHACLCICSSKIYCLRDSTEKHNPDFMRVNDNF